MKTVNNTPRISKILAVFCIVFLLSLSLATSIAETSYETLALLKKRIQEIVAEYTSLGMSEYQKALNLYDWVCINAQYDYSAYEGNGWSGKYDPHLPESVILDGWGVCGGFASAYNMLLKEAGIWSFTVDGFANGELHAWNIAKIDGKYYQFDPTWDEGGNGNYHTFFALTDKAMEASGHKQRTGLQYICNSYEANYFYVSNSSEYDAAAAVFQAEIDHRIAQGIHSDTFWIDLDNLGMSYPIDTQAIESLLPTILEKVGTWAEPGIIEIAEFKSEMMGDYDWGYSCSYTFLPNEVIVEDIIVNNINSNPAYLCLYEGYQAQTKVSTVPANVQIQMSSSNESVFTVSASGKLTAVKEGYANWTITAGKESIIWPIKVYTLEEMNDFLTYELSNGFYTGGLRKCNPGDAFPIEVDPDSELAFADNTLTWRSSNENVATVDETGWVRCVGQGAATISATFGWGACDKIELQVRDEVTAVIFEQPIYESTVDEDCFIIRAWLEGCDQDVYKELYGNLSWRRGGYYHSSIAPYWEELQQRWIYCQEYGSRTPGIDIVTAQAMDGSKTSGSCVVIIHDKTPFNLPAGLKMIKREAFAQISAAEIMIAEGTHSIGSRAFADCKKLRLIMIPETVTSIAEDAFEGSSHVGILCKKGSFAEEFATKSGINYVALEK